MSAINDILAKEEPKKTPSAVQSQEQNTGSITPSVVTAEQSAPKRDIGNTISEVTPPVQANAQVQTQTDQIKAGHEAAVADGSKHTLAPGNVESQTTDKTMADESIGKVHEENKDRGRYQNMQDIFVALGNKKPLTPEEQAEEDKREKRNKMFSAIGDGLASMANLYFATQGANNMIDPERSMSKKTEDYWDKLKAERRANANAWTNYRLKMEEILNEKDKVKASQELAKLQQEYNHAYNTAKLNADIADKKRQRDIQETNSKISYAKLQQAAEQFKVKTDIDRQKLALSAKRLEQGAQKGYYPFETDGGTVNVPVSKMNAVQVKNIFNNLDDNVKSQWHGKRTNSEYAATPEYEQPTTEQMLMAIAENSANPKISAALNRVAGNTNDYSKYEVSGEDPYAKSKRQ